MKRFDATTRKDILDAIAAGNHASQAAAYAGITPARLTGWLRRGREEVERIQDSEVAQPVVSEQEYAEFFIAFKMAESKLSNKLTTSIMAARNWRAKAWMLERRFPDEWGRKVEERNNEADDWWQAVEEAEAERTAALSSQAVDMDK